MGHSLREAWRDGQALFLISHRDCSTTREAIPVFERIHRRRTRGSVSEGFRRADLEAFAERLGLAGPRFLPDDRFPAFRPG